MFNLTSDFFIAALIISGVLSVSIAISAWRRRQAAGVSAFTGMMVGVAVWSLGYAIELATTSPESKIFWNQVLYLGVVTTPVSWLIFSLAYTGENTSLTKKQILSLFALPTVTTILIWTNAIHHLFWADTQISSTSTISTMVGSRAIWFWVHAAYSYICLMVGTFFLIRFAINYQSRLYRGQVVSLLVAVVTPWLGNATYIFNLSPLELLDPTPFAFTITGIALSLGIFRYRLLDILPATHNAVLASMTDGVIVLDMNNRIVEINPSAQDFIQNANPGKPIKVGDNALHVFSIWPQVLERFKDVTRAIATEVPFKIGDRTRFIDLRISPLWDPNSKMVGRVVVTTDVSARKVNADLEKAKEAAEAANQAKSAFFASMSHELRTPLNHIIGYSEMLMEDVELNQHSDLYAEDLKKVHDAGKTLLHIISQVLELAKLEAGRVSIQPEEFTLDSLIEDICIHEQAVLEQNGNTLQRYLPEERIIMHSDPHKLRQALSHILNNAARFTKGGLIMVRTKVVRNRVEIQIEDTGEGMSNNQLDQLFKSFTNADNTNRRKNEGLGLSLATAHQLISLLGGSIGVNSTIGAGSVFTVRLPAKILEE